LVELRFGEGKALVKANPVEFKRGHKKESDVDRVQLCAQAICIEEMLGIVIETAQFYYFKEHRRSEVEIDSELRGKTVELIDKIRMINSNRKTPKAVYKKRKCDNCSLVDICMPKYIEKPVKKYIQNQLEKTKADNF
jgi:CRISPR-associated exonuclease Cas4